MSDTHLEIERTYDLPEGGALPDLIGVGAVSGFVALAIALVWLLRYERFRVRYDADTRLHLAITHAIPVVGPRPAPAPRRQGRAPAAAVA
ncbi:hypothetical protein IAE22_33340, partial [Bacillus sp. S34]|nr:hypothetical protein [Bacillus sp. S34]